MSSSPWPMRAAIWPMLCSRQYRDALGNSDSGIVGQPTPSPWSRVPTLACAQLSYQTQNVVATL